MTEPSSSRPQPLAPGDRIPSFRARSAAGRDFQFDTAAGRWLVLGLIGSAGPAPLAERCAAVLAASDVFDDRHASLFLVSNEAADEAEARLAERLPGRRVFWDTELAIPRLLGALEGPDRLRPGWLVIDPALTLHRIIPLRRDGSDLPELLALLRNLPPPARPFGFELPVPILILPDVFEPAFCDHLIHLYESHGGAVSGFMRDQGGQTVAVHDKGFKVRRDHTLTDPGDIRAAQARILRRVIPQIERVHFFRATRMERYMIGCYDAGEGGHFQPHRDNTTLGTRHRRFAVSINLSDDFDGGEVGFPEYGPRSYKGPKGSAVVFSCSLLHSVSRVTCGRRYAFLPFLYDEAAARLREANAAQVPNAAGYRADTAGTQPSG